MATWTTENKFRLLLAVMEAEGLEKGGHKWKEVEELMNGDFGWNACRQQYQKIRSSVGTLLNRAPKENGKGTPNAKDTPKKRASSPATPTPKTSKRKNSKQNEHDDLTTDAYKAEDEGLAKKKAKQTVKEEPLEADEFLHEVAL